jgi:hypothetical protein
MRLVRLKNRATMSSRVGVAVAGVRNVAKMGNGFRRYSRVPVLDHAVKSKIGFALGESQSTVSQRFSGCVWDSLITCASMAG